ncbi:MAG: L-seryl-tRNA(Sec) selenium transferase, partial [Candidatus Obscuribacterales bacterium]|nr:L-seryl-tRNA(Sec) selenium transferase [Candidatus Obscuribacterales bacterium]
MKKAQPKQHIPQVDKVLRHPLMEETSQLVRREILTRLVRAELDAIRQGTSQSNELDEIADKVKQKALSLIKPRLRRVINGTGVVLNTNLGRAPLPKQALNNISEIGQHYSNLEYDLDTGKRGERTTYIEELLALLTGCESAIVVNNNAAAVLLAVNTLAPKRDVIVSRGELIEIGGSFRLPEVIVSAGGKLKEVGTTNKTRIKDYQHAISDKTGLLLRCHRSNFAISGFCEEASREQLVELSKKHKIPLVEDLGSGALTNFYDFATSEPPVAEVISKGINLVTISADKLLGGPQAGIILGDRKLVKALRKNPLYRCLRPDKLIISALESLLADYLTPNSKDTIPV